MKKLLMVLCFICFLTSCSKQTNKETNPDIVFKNELDMIQDINENKGKILVEKLVFEDIDNALNELFKLAIFEDYAIEYGEIIQGVGSDGNGGKTFCCKLPVKVSFTGDKSTVEKFITYFKELETVSTIGNFDIKMIENEKVNVNTTVSFLGQTTEEKLVSTKKEYSIKKNEAKVEEVSEIILRDFDIGMTVRPCNSDAASITLGVINDTDNRIYNDENSRRKVIVNFSNSGKDYYCEYGFDDDSLKKAKISPKSDIFFDILSCDLIEDDDNIFVDLYITNNSNKKVSIVIYNDKDSRINIAYNKGNIEVKRK